MHTCSLYLQRIRGFYTLMMETAVSPLEYLSTKLYGVISQKTAISIYSTYIDKYFSTRSSLDKIHNLQIRTNNIPHYQTYGNILDLSLG
jgi:hypothetical protein